MAISGDLGPWVRGVAFRCDSPAHLSLLAGGLVRCPRRGEAFVHAYTACALLACPAFQGFANWDQEQAWVRCGEGA